MLRRLVWAACAIGATAGTAGAAEAFVGRWAISPAACSGYGNTLLTAPLIASDTTVRWYQGACRIGKMYKLGTAVYIQARCDEDTTTDTPITLDARGAERLRVTWNRGRTENCGVAIERRQERRMNIRAIAGTGRGVVRRARLGRAEHDTKAAPKQRKS